jgi:hypothetical protein
MRKFNFQTTQAIKNYNNSCPYNIFFKFYRVFNHLDRDKNIYRMECIHDFNYDSGAGIILDFITWIVEKIPLKERVYACYL